MSEVITDELVDYIEESVNGRARSTVAEREYGRALLDVLVIADRMAREDFRGPEPRERALGRQIRKVIADELNFTS